MRLRSDILVRRSGGATQLFDRRGGGVFALNAVGALVVEALGRGESRAEIARALSERFDVTALVANTDLAGFLENLEKHGLVEG